LHEHCVCVGNVVVDTVDSKQVVDMNLAAEDTRREAHAKLVLDTKQTVDDKPAVPDSRPTVPDNRPAVPAAAEHKPVAVAPKEMTDHRPPAVADHKPAVVETKQVSRMALQTFIKWMISIFAELLSVQCIVMNRQVH